MSGKKRLSTFLVFTEKGVKGTTKRMPKLRQSEYMVKLHLDVPQSLFTFDPPTATIAVPERSVVRPEIVVAAIS